MGKLKEAMMNAVEYVFIDSSGQAAVDSLYFWQPIHTCPRNVKVQLLGEGQVAMYGILNGSNDFFTHWAPLPKIPKEHNNV